MRAIRRWRAARRASDSAREPVARGTACGRARFNAKGPVLQCPCTAGEPATKANAARAGCLLAGRRTNQSRTRTNPPYQTDAMFKTARNTQKILLRKLGGVTSVFDELFRKPCFKFQNPSTFPNVRDMEIADQTREKSCHSGSRNSRKPAAPPNLVRQSFSRIDPRSCTMGRLLPDAQKGNTFL
jgi:hypothetical protein